MIKRVNSVQYAYNKIILQSNQHIIYESWFGNLVDKAKAGLNKVKDIATKITGALGNWLKSLWGLIKFGVLVLSRSVSGSYKKNPSQYASDSNQLQTSLYGVLPFFKTPMSVIDKAGMQTHEKEYKQLKNSLKGKKDQTSNVDNASKNIGKALWERAKSPFISAVKNSTNEAKSMGQQMKQKSKIPQSVASKYINTNNTTDKDKQNTSLTTEDLQVINENAIKYQHDLHNLIIDWVYKGLTPKVIMEHIDNNITNSPQGNIIIQNNLLSFKTNNGQLICEETNLNTHNVIIYESNCKFKGTHLIYEQTIGKYKKFNNIITESEVQQTDNIINQQIGIFQITTIISIVLTIVSLISLIKHVILTPLHTITGGLSAVASETTKPVETGGRYSSSVMLQLWVHKKLVKLQQNRQ